MLARIGPVGTAAGCTEIGLFRRKEARPSRLEGGVDISRHLAREKLRGELGLLGHGRNGLGPHPFRQPDQGEGHFVWCRARTRHLGSHLAVLDDEIVGSSRARIGSTAREAARVAIGDVLERLNPALAPPGGAALLHFDAPFWRWLLARWCVPAPAVPRAHGCTAAARRLR